MHQRTACLGVRSGIEKHTRHKNLKFQASAVATPHPSGLLKVGALLSLAQRGFPISADLGKGKKRKAKTNKQKIQKNKRQKAR